MAGTCRSVAEVARDGDRLASSNLAAFCGGTRRGLTNSRAAMRNRKHAVMESGGGTQASFALFLFFPSLLPRGRGINESARKSNCRRCEVRGGRKEG